MANTHLILNGAGTDAGSALVDEEGGVAALGSGHFLIRDGIDNIEIRNGAVRDEALCTVQDVVIPVLNCSRGSI